MASTLRLIFLCSGGCLDQIYKASWPFWTINKTKRRKQKHCNWFSINQHLFLFFFFFHVVVDECFFYFILVLRGLFVTIPRIIRFLIYWWSIIIIYTNLMIIHKFFFFLKTKKQTKSILRVLPWNNRKKRGHSWYL